LRGELPGSVPSAEVGGPGRIESVPEKSRARSASCSTRSSYGPCWSPRWTWTSGGGCGGPARSRASPTQQ